LCRLARSWKTSISENCGGKEISPLLFVLCDFYSKDWKKYEFHSSWKRCKFEGNKFLKKKQVRITCWLDEDILQAFNMIYPAHGATTTFVRKAFSQIIRQNRAKVRDLFHELDLEKDENE
jgi:hypothetical protein